jgi:hypothetical protein
MFLGLQIETPLSVCVVTGRGRVVVGRLGWSNTGDLGLRHWPGPKNATLIGSSSGWVRLRHHSETTDCLAQLLEEDLGELREAARVIVFPDEWRVAWPWKLSSS